jgi:2-polyprenyl-6-methoxyphenol hydroxylase-like FAD-dependent oxidoreductase
MFAAAAVARTGATVTILERDTLPAGPDSRPGVPQDRQPHVLLHRGRLAAEALLPGLSQDLLAAGAVRINSGEIPSFGEFGWLPTEERSYEILSLTRPLLEHLVRRRVLALDQVLLEEGARVTGLRRTGEGWRVLRSGAKAEGAVTECDVVVEASGRGSRLPHWLAGLGVDVRPPEIVEARLGYASRAYRATGPLPVRSGVAVAATPETATGGLAIPVEDDGWLVIGAGYGDARPGRSVADFERFLGALRDPVLLDLVRRLEPDGDVAVHRQTANRRHRYGQGRNWPSGLLVVGDSLCAFDPVFGQGITVAACQAQLLTRLLAVVQTPTGTRLAQLRLSGLADLPWSVATSQDLRQPSCTSDPDRLQRASIAWGERLGRLAAGGDPRALRTFAEVYHLMAPPHRLVSPALVASVLQAELRGYPPSRSRPVVLDELSSAPV